MPKFAKGGYVPSASTITIERVGQCINGHCLYRIDGVVQHIFSTQQIRERDFCRSDEAVTK